MKRKHLKRSLLLAGSLLMFAGMHGQTTSALATASPDRPVLSHVTTPTLATQHRAAAQADDLWGDWYEFDNGVFYYGNAYSALGLTEPNVRTTVLRRDNAADSTKAQLNFTGIFSGTDFIVNLDTETMFMTWDDMELPYTNEASTYDGQHLWLMGTTATGQFVWSPKNDMVTFFYFLVAPGYGYQSSGAGYVSNKKPIPRPRLTMVEHDTDCLNTRYLSAYYGNTATQASFDYEPDSIITYAEYIWYKAPGYIDESGNVVRYLDNFSYKSEISKELKPGRLNLDFFDGPGIYTLAVRFYDKDNDCLISSRVSCLSNLYDTYEWETLGTGKLEIPLFSDYAVWSPGMTPYCTYTPDVASIGAYEVTVERRKDNHNIYRVVNPFGQGTPFENITSVSAQFSDGFLSSDDDFITFFHDQDYYLVFDNSDPEYPFVDDRARGFHWSNSGGDTWYSAKYDKLNYRAPLLPEERPIRDNVIYCGSNKTVPEFVLWLPGANEAAVDMACEPVDPSQANPTDKMFNHHSSAASAVNVDIELGIDISCAYIAAVPTAEYDPVTTVDDIVNRRIPVTSTFDSGTFRVTLTPPSSASTASAARAEANPNDYTVVVASFIGRGTLKKVTTEQIDVTAIDEFATKIGTAQMTDPIAYILNMPYVVTTDVYESSQRPGVYLLKSPWDNQAFDPTILGRHCDESHDWVIDATTPDAVHVERGFTGLKDVDYNIYLLDCDTYSSLTGSDIRGHGTLTKSDNIETIQFYGTLLLGYEDSAAPNRFSFSGDLPYNLTVQITRTSGVDAIESDTTADAPAEYFNLQGMKVENPVPGTIYIKRQGTAVSKIRY